MERPERVVDALTSRGILLVQDAAAQPDNFKLYEALAAAGKLTIRVNAAQYLPPNDFRTTSGKLDIPRAVRVARARRERYADNPLIRADAVKIFVDGVLEGNPNGDPPTLPNAARLRPYLRPRFVRRSDGTLQVAGYLDARSSRIHSRGLLLLPRRELLAWAAGFHEAGFALHFHAIGEGAVHAAIDAVEFARRDGIASLADTIAHAQLVDPRDVIRLGRDHLFMAYTYAWFYTDPEYDMSVIPFIDRVSGSGIAALHQPDFYYERNAYAARSVKSAGATLIAGSDAPVDTRDPRPFVNMELALTRSLPGKPPLNAAEALTLMEVLDAYTINGARALGRAQETGSIEIGKSADLILVDQDILTLAAGGAADRIGQTHVLGAWFKGRPVFTAGGGRTP
jgi:predicted amidohydrolase YtcJ